MLTAELIEGFVTSVLSKNFNGRVETPDFHREVWDLCCNKHRFVAIAAPRGFAKSTAVTHCYTLANLMFRERSFAVIVSDTETQAVMFLQDLKKELEDNEDLIQLFGLKRDAQGKTKFIKETESDFICAFQDGTQFRVVAKGSEQKVRGLKWGHKRPDLIVCDDLENDEIVLNKERREKFKKWFLSALLPIRSDNGIVRVVGTILHMDSLLQGLMPDAQLARFKKHRDLMTSPLKEWSKSKLPWLSVKYRAHSEDFTQLLWGAKKGRAELETIRADYIAQGYPEGYSQEYLNVPIDESFAIFRKSDLAPLSDGDLQENVVYYATADLAVSEKDRADWTVFTIAGLDSKGVLQIRKVIRDRMDASTIVDTMLHIQRQYEIHYFGVEEGVIAKSILPFLREKMVSTGTYLNFFYLRPSTDKVTRCRSINARMRAGGVRFNKDTDWYVDLESEMLRFPRDKHDDQVDSLSYMGLMLDKLIEAPTPEEVHQADRELELEEAQLGNDGRSPITGY